MVILYGEFSHNANIFTCTREFQIETKIKFNKRKPVEQEKKPKYQEIDREHSEKCTTFWLLRDTSMHRKGHMIRFRAHKQHALTYNDTKLKSIKYKRIYLDKTWFDKKIPTPSSKKKLSAF